ncbi:MAG: GNAT family N-acetyltransferase [Roseovarius sp.]|uniref:GNAT family N-acetyltransferase n=1 Tax=Roseovarius sp. TaxID=1486281 RepID=UPI0032EF1C4F
MTPILTPGFDRAERPHAAHLFWQAFRGKLGAVLAPEDKALSFLSAALHPDFAISARDPDGRLLGLAGVKTARGGLVGGGWRDLARVYGWPGALWRGGALSLLERQVRPDTLLMDGIFVAEDARGRGVGSALLGAVKARAAEDGKSSVRLDVIDSNPRARALYERHGFVAGDVTHIGPLHHLFGFRSSTEMHCAIPAPAPDCRNAAN